MAASESAVISAYIDLSMSFRMLVAILILVATLLKKIILKHLPNKLRLGNLVTAAIIAYATPILAQDLQEPLSEETVRDFFVFADDANVKYVNCEANSFPTCTYVWGASHSKDAARLEYGLSPESNTIMTIFAQAGRRVGFCLDHVMKYRLQCFVSRSTAWPENPQLGNWASNQRATATKGKMPEDRRCRLKEIEFRF